MNRDSLRDALRNVKEEVESLEQQVTRMTKKEFNTAEYWEERVLTSARALVRVKDAQSFGNALNRLINNSIRLVRAETEGR